LSISSLRLVIELGRTTIEGSLCLSFGCDVFLDTRQSRNSFIKFNTVRVFSDNFATGRPVGFFKNLKENKVHIGDIVTGNKLFALEEFFNRFKTFKSSFFEYFHIILNIAKLINLFIEVTIDYILSHSNNTSFLSSCSKKLGTVLCCEVLVNCGGLSKLMLAIDPVRYVREIHTHIEFLSEPSLRVSVFLHFVFSTHISKLESDGCSSTSATSPVSKGRFHSTEFSSENFFTPSFTGIKICLSNTRLTMDQVHRESKLTELLTLQVVTRDPSALKNVLLVNVNKGAPLFSVKHAILVDISLCKVLSSDSQALSFLFRVLCTLSKVFTNIFLILSRVGCRLLHEVLQEHSVPFVRLVSRIGEPKLSFHCAHRSKLESHTQSSNCMVRFNLRHPPGDGRVSHMEFVSLIDKVSVKSFTPELNIGNSDLVSTYQVSVVGTSLLAVNIKLVISSPHLGECIFPRSLALAKLDHDWSEDSRSEDLTVELKKLINLGCFGSRVETSIGSFLSDILKSNGTFLVLIGTIN